MRRAAAAGAILVLWAGIFAGAAVALLGGGASAGAAPATPPLVVQHALPEWLAPGAPLRVDGSAGTEERVELLVGARVVARARTSRQGRFRLVARAPRPGRHAVAVRAPDRRDEGMSGDLSQGQTEGQTQGQTQGQTEGQTQGPTEGQTQGQTQRQTQGHAFRRLGVLTVRPVRLAAVGDVMFSESVGRGIAERGAAHPWSAAGRLLRAADIATANLETAVSVRGAPVAGKQFTFRGEPAALAGMARTGGVDVVSVANNHSLDYGAAAFLDTLRYARAAGIVTVGGGATDAAARRPVVIRRGGLRIAFLGYSDVNPLGFPAGPSTPGTARALPEHVTADVRRARRHADLVVCWFHWGEELRAEPTAGQRVLAAAALAGGAHVVLGAHPHTLGQVTAPKRGSVVAWSLGNFVFPSFRAETVRTGVLVVRLGAGGVLGHDLVPHRIDGYRPAPVTGET